MTLLTQVQIEETMYGAGIIRAENMMNKAEDNGRAHQNPYAKEIFREYVLPLASAIRSELSVKRAGVRQAHASLLDGLDADAVAFLAIRYSLSNLLGPGPEGHRKLAYGIGRTIHRELCLVQIEQHCPELYFTLSRDFGRRLSKSERHRMTVFMMQAKQAGISVTEWQIGSREQVGFYLLGLLEAMGLVDIGPELRIGMKYKERTISVNPEIMERIDKVKAYVAVTMPVFGPCVEPPRPWGFKQPGGFHTQRMCNTGNNLVHGSQLCRQTVAETDMPIVYAAVNALQETAWAVNKRMLDTVRQVAAHFSTKEIVSLTDHPKPPAPAWLAKGMGTENMTEAQRTEFVTWKHCMADWYTSRKLLGTRYGRFYAATRAAETFWEYPAIYFVHFADSRGRLYPLTYGLNPQGSDLSKALLHFAEAKALPDTVAVRWFHIQGANKWGFDKATLPERMAWVEERKEYFAAMAEDPIANNDWRQAGDPLQFLAWVLEYGDYLKDPANFKSRLPISMDGSCNGLQNLSALFRDEVGGKATNLTANAVMEDIYNRVAEAATKRLTAMILEDPAEQALQAGWLKHGISRKAVKRSVMTTPYGVTRRSATEYVVDDYLREGLGPTFDKAHYRKAAELLMKAVWPAIGDVVVKGREAMDWLKKSARPALRCLPAGHEPFIQWPTPSGFPASQSYFEAQEHRINTRLHGLVKIKVLSETEEPSFTKHASGLAPNFVHSMDAAHLHLSTAAAAGAGITFLAMIHDDYGTHAADAQKLYEIIRAQFVYMYTTFDPIKDFCDRYPAIPKPPSRGKLDIQEVLSSPYFFS